MKTLIIGASGFVGNYLIRQFSDVGWEVEATCLPSENLTTAIPIHKLDILDPENIKSVLSCVKPEVIIHLAAQSSVALSWKNPALTVDVNIKGAINVLEAVKDINKSIRVLLIGSGEQYGAVSSDYIPIDENVPQSPGNVYAVTKYTQDILGDLYTKAYDLDIVRVRAFNHIGPGQSPQFVVSDFCKQIAMLEKSDGPYVMKVGNLAAKRDFTDVRDVVRAYYMLCNTGKKGQAYNVGSGVSVSIQNILDTIIGLSEKEIVVEIDQEKFRPVDVPIIEADISKLINDTGWRPQICLEDTIKETLEYWRESIG